MTHYCWSAVTLIRVTMTSWLNAEDRREMIQLMVCSVDRVSIDDGKWQKKRIMSYHIRLL